MEIWKSVSRNNPWRIWSFKAWNDKKKARFKKKEGIFLKENKWKKRLAVLGLAVMLGVTGCKNQTQSNDNNENNDNVANENNSGNESVKIDESEMFTDRDYRSEYDESKSVKISLNGDSASCDSDAVKISGTKITILDEGTFVFSGTLEDGMIIVNADEKDKPQIVLDNASIKSATSAPLYILEADKVFVTLAEGTGNTLENGGEFVAVDDNNIDGAIFSKQDLTLNGSGSLTVSSPADHGIVCKDDLVFTGGTYTINSASHGLDVNDSVRVTKASISIDAGKDGVHVDNEDNAEKGFFYGLDGSFDIEAEGDGISAGSFLTVKDGTYAIVSGGGSENATKTSSDNWGGFMGGGPGGMGGGRSGGRGDSMGNRRDSSEGKSYDSEKMSSVERMATDSSSDSNDESTSLKGIKAAGDLVIENGSFTIDSADDSVHSNSSITVNGGTFQIAAGDDAFHADDTLTIKNGKIDISECYEGLEALHVKVEGGDIKLVATDDGLNAAGGTDQSGAGGRDNGAFGGRGQFGGGMSSSSNGSIVVSGGNLYVNSSGDGMDANGTLEITGGYTVIVGPTQGDTATLDYDKTGVITGGTFIGTGSSMMAQSFSDSEQGVVAVSVGNCEAGTQIILKDSSGKEIITHTPELSFAVVILSSPEIEKGETYTILVGSASGEFQAN